MERYFKKAVPAPIETSSSEEDNLNEVEPKNTKRCSQRIDLQTSESESSCSYSDEESPRRKTKRYYIHMPLLLFFLLNDVFLWRRYTQQVRKAWFSDKRFKDWISEYDDKILCKFCGCKLTPKLCTLIAHANTKKHKATAGPFLRGKQATISFKAVGIIYDTKRAELANALYVASHTAICSVDHLSTIQRNSFHDSSIATGIKLARSKCSALIRNVLCPYFKNRLLSDIGSNPYSLIIDESTDISVKKYLGIVIRYYSATSKSIVNTFLTLSVIEDCTAKGLVDSILKTLSEFGLDIKNLRGLGTDNASVMVGRNRGVISLLKQHQPNIVLVPCVCHSIQLAVSSASKLLPNKIEFLISETYNWFSKSASRQNSYSMLYAAINDGLEPLQMVRACSTRWLSIEVAVKRVTSQWLELKTHFGIAATVECCHKAKLLANLFSDENLAYLMFLGPILKEVQMVNKLFESNSVDPLKMFSDLKYLLSNLCSLVTYSSETFDPLSSPLLPLLIPLPCFHYSFEEFMKTNINDIDTEKNIRDNCRSFLIKLIEQLRQRLPSNIDTLKNINFFSMEKALSAVKTNIFDSFKQEKCRYTSDEISNIEMQWKKLHLIEWEGIDSTVAFWTQVREYKNAFGENPFASLSNFVFEFLVLPLSNAEVERIFSTMNNVKTKVRNRTSTTMLNAILCIRYGLKKEKKCCHDFVITKDLISLMNNSSIYSYSSDDEENFDIEI
ncbi:uncharacterized protein LOC129246064 isoform X1 [Anastrepha obliqua]|uniref:uncharacterized protein LOC129246064 isoform X1 n=1 Tax=Anastrepha obliqua TaxID=95512 RepID=UPI00240A3666|nr:uncharacterized protein LOC129246064 isoform X1 [Anastrepha obliqua]